MYEIGREGEAAAAAAFGCYIIFEGEGESFENGKLAGEKERTRKCISEKSSEG